MISGDRLEISQVREIYVYDIVSVVNVEVAVPCELTITNRSLRHPLLAVSGGGHKVIFG